MYRYGLINIILLLVIAMLSAYIYIELSQTFKFISVIRRGWGFLDAKIIEQERIIKYGDRKITSFTKHIDIDLEVLNFLEELHRVTKDGVSVSNFNKAIRVILKIINVIGSVNRYIDIITSLKWL